MLGEPHLTSRNAKEGAHRPGTDRDSEEIGLIHGIEDDPAERVVCVVEVLDALVPAAGMQCLHGPLQRLGDDPDAIIGIAMELAGPHA